MNVCGVIITTNYRSDGLYLPADDRRHFVAWSEKSREDFTSDYWTDFHQWYQDGGIWDVVAYLKTIDLSNFNPKAPPPKTAAFWSIVQANQAPESGEIRELLDGMNNPNAITLNQLLEAAALCGLVELARELQDKGKRRIWSGRLEGVGYGSVKNPDSPTDGLYNIKLSGGKRRMTVYARRSLSTADQLKAARELQDQLNQ